jgi:type VI protein secretion system component Hcp
MKKSIIFGFAIVLTAIVTVVGLAQAGVIDAFLMLDGLPAGCGLSKDEQFNGQIIVKSFGQRITHDTDKLGLPTGTSESRGISILKDPDSCSPTLFLDSVMERDIATMQISFRDCESRVIIAQVTGIDVQIVSMGLDEASQGLGLAESLTFAVVGQLRMSITEVGADGKPGRTATSCWDFKRNAAC